MDERSEVIHGRDVERCMKALLKVGCKSWSPGQLYLASKLLSEFLQAEFDIKMSAPHSYSEN